MTAGIKRLRKVQLGRETTAGTAVAATTLWRGEGVIEDTRELTVVEESIGFLSPHTRSYVGKIGAAISMDAVPATFEQLPHLLEAGVMTATPAQDSGGSGYLYTYDFPTTAEKVIKTYTIEGGDNIQAEEIEYAFVKSFKIEGKVGEAVMMGAEWVGRQVTKTTFTTTATLPVVEEILTSKGKLYIDAVSGTAGTTQISSSLLDFSFGGDTGLMEVHTIDGTLYYTFVKNTGPELTLDVTFEHDTNSVAQKDAWIAQTPKLVQLKFEGATLTTAGVYSVKTLIITLAGLWEKFDSLSDSDGNDTIKGSFKVLYDPTAAKYAQMIIVNELTALP